ncbi:uncharacterized protein V1518DRAFT_188925 [Limtongia smithiae]|uniref:uncharacterized protein n=1 Tax=Limtongia smithiae TaxID=1125753 RepID=UPI0034CD7680
MAQSALSAALSAYAAGSDRDSPLDSSRRDSSSSVSPRYATSSSLGAVSGFTVGENGGGSTRSAVHGTGPLPVKYRRPATHSPVMKPAGSSGGGSYSGRGGPVFGSLRERSSLSSGVFSPPKNGSIPVSPNVFPFSPPLSGVRVLRDRPRRGSSVVTTTVVSSYDGELMFSSSFDDSEIAMEGDEDLDNMDVDDMDLDYRSDTDEEDWQSAGVESLRRENGFKLMNKQHVSSVSSGSFLSSRASVSSGDTANTKVSSVFSQSVPAGVFGKVKAAYPGHESKAFGVHTEADREQREAEAIAALVQLRSL